MTALVQNAISWGFVCGRIAVLERTLLGFDFYNTLLGHEHSEDLLRQLQETPLRDAVTAAGAWEDWSAIIDRHFYDQVASIRKDCPDERVPNLFLMQGDYQNLKRALTGQTVYPFQHAVLTTEMLNACATRDFLAVPSPYRETAQAAARVIEERSLSHLDLVLDGAYVRHLHESAHAVQVPLIAEYYDFYALLRSITVLWRSHLAGGSLSAPASHILPLGELSRIIRDLVAAADPKQWAGIVPGALGVALARHVDAGTADAPQRFEGEAFDLLAEIARFGRGQVFGPERVFAYLCALATEAYNLKLIVSGRLSRIDADILKRRLRKPHA
ncbi:MAG: V-type ATPase subunit [Candidatus Hydrogenedentes bacterium]|nr:V-type ATPase subunit [Candidatus Hydrogenedentota bacterium]